MPNRQQLRHNIHNHLKHSISKNYLLWASQQACTTLIQNELFTQARHVACYWPMPREADCRGIIEACHQNNKACYLPVIDLEQPRSMQFKLYQPQTLLTTNHLGIKEPDTQTIIDPFELDLVITPLVAFDNLGYRLGQGGGYYDTTFAHKKSGQQPYLCGFALALQQVTNIQPQAWDIPLDYIATEQGLTDLKQS